MAIEPTLEKARNAGTLKRQRKVLTLRERPPARHKTATLAKSTDYLDLPVRLPATMPRGVASIRGA
eukprot:3745153-Pyramimonas_sp.AAC.1